MRHIKNYRREFGQFQKRLLKATLLIGLLSLLLVGRLYDLQITNHQRYATLATNNQLEHIPIEANRGLIYDRNGVLLAENLPTFSLNLMVQDEKKLDPTIAQLKTILPITPEEIKRFKHHLSRQRRFELVPLKNRLTPEEIATFYVNQHRFPGVTIEATMTRHYPEQENLAHVTGYVGRINKADLHHDASYSPNGVIGKTGIEKFYENLLRGKTGYRVVEVGAQGKIIRTLQIIPPTAGTTLYLTIDSRLQKLAREALGEEKGAVVVIDPNNGEILAMVSHPSYDPNLFSRGIDNSTFNRLSQSAQRPMYNRATQGQFPLASTIKPFLAIRGLDNGIITPQFRIVDPGWFKLANNNHLYLDWRHSGHGIVNVTKAIAVSCDVFFYTLAVKMGIHQIAEVLQQFGFGNKLHLDLTEESTGIVATPHWKIGHTGKRWYTGDTVLSGIGQGFMSATPMQLAHGVATLAMRGQRIQPHLLLSQKHPDGRIIPYSPIPLTPVKLKNPQNWKIVIEAMQAAVMQPEGTAHLRFGSPPSYTVAGKTGEAQLYRRRDRNLSWSPQATPKHLRNHNLFIAFAPVEKPTVAVAVITENSNLAVKTTRQILDYLLANSTARSNTYSSLQPPNNAPPANLSNLPQPSPQLSLQSEISTKLTQNKPAGGTST